ncbi:MAG: SPFH domain-containing protein [Candidatus Paceibacterota bacterium]|jgi:regulator of protease activity HflC (stomatin/prohibitin superfamily)
MQTFMEVVLFLAVVYVALDALVIVPEPSFGVHLRFNKRTGRIIEEGLESKIPLIDKVELFSTELDKIEVNVNFTTIDKLQLTLVGSLQYRPDPRISDDPADLNRLAENRRGKNTFFAMSQEIIKSGIEDALRSLLGGLGGVYEGSKFIGNRQALGSLINSILRLSKPPHLNHNAGTCGIPGCAMPEKIDAQDLVSFYNTHWKGVQDDIEQGKKNDTECSPIEIRYGIDIETFALANVDFSDATKEAFEKEKQAEARQKAFRFKMEMAQEAKKLGASAQEALNAADVSLDPKVSKQIVSVEGEAGVLGGIVSKIGGK